MKLLLSHGYFLCEDVKEQEIMKPYPPLGILYLSAWLERHGVEHEVFDTTFSDKPALERRLLEQRPDILALYVNLMTKLNILALIRFVRSRPELRDCLVVLGGPDVTHNAEDYLQAGADLIVVGEGEQTMLEIAQAHRPGSALDFSGIEGLVYRGADGVRRTPARGKLKNLDDLPVPNRQKIDLQQYLNAWKKAHGHSAVSVSTQRGCPYTCRWCSTAVYGQSYRRRSPEAVAEEIALLQAQYDFDLIWFVDDVFTVSHKWLAAFRDELRARDMQIRFECITRADRLNEEVIGVLRDCGCFRVWIGAESGSQNVIDAMDRRVDVRQVRDMIRATKRAGIQAGTFIMLGYPGETEADIEETVEHLVESGPDLFTITVAYPIKGTGLYETVEPHIRAEAPWQERSDRDLDFKRSYPRRYYDYAVRWTVNSVHWRRLKREGRRFTATALKHWVKAAGARAGMWWVRNQVGVQGNRIKIPGTTSIF